MSKVKINKVSSEPKKEEIPAYKKVKDTVTYVYNSKNRIIDWYTSYKNMQSKIEKYKDLEVR